MSGLSRREALFSLGTGAAVLTAGCATKAVAPPVAPTPPPVKDEKVVKIGRLKQSVSYWCFAKKFSLPELCKQVKAMGMGAIDLLKEEEWPIVRDHGLVCSMAYGGGGSIPEGLNKKSNHDAIVKGLEASIPKVAAFGFPNIITFFGNRVPDMTEQEAIDNCIEGLNRVKAVAEQSRVTVCVELLNSKVNHKGYQGDHSEFGLKVVKAVNSPRIKLLDDLYHMQIMEGDIIRTLRDNKEWIGHFHTGGVPGRHELDDTQELNWRTVAKAIADSGYTGYMAHEFVPLRDPLTSLREAVALCDV